MEITYEDSWSNMAQPCDINLWVMKSFSAWPIFHGPVTLTYILKSIWCMNIIVQDYESVQPDVWPQINIGQHESFYQDHCCQGHQLTEFLFLFLFLVIQALSGVSKPTVMFWWFHYQPDVGPSSWNQHAKSLFLFLVVQACHLSSKWRKQAHSYVLVSIVPDDTNTARRRTSVVKETNSPSFCFYF